MYLAIGCLEDPFFDIVFDLMINDETYNYKNFPCSSEGEYKDKTKKTLSNICFIFINGVILLGCIYVLIFILIPIIKYRIIQFSKRKKENINDFRERIGSSNAALLKERLTSENN